MGFNKVYLPSPEELNRQLAESREMTIRWLQKADAMIGSEDSIKIAEDIRKMKIR